MGLAALLAGCSTSNSSQQPQDDPEPQQNNSDQPAEEPSEGEGTQQESDGEQDDDDEEQVAASAWNWKYVLEAGREGQQRLRIDHLAERALSGEKIGPNLKKDIDNWAYEYSHRKGYWDLQHFQILDLTDESEFLQAVNDALTVTNHYMHSKEGNYASRFNNKMGATAEQILEEGHDIDNIKMWGWGNEGHGFNYILSEDHGVYTVDGATTAIGRAGTQPLQGTTGTDIISQYEDSWLEDSDSESVIKTTLLQNFLTNGIYDGLLDVNEKAVGYHMDHLPSLVDIYKAENSGEFLWNVHRPAVATTVNRLARDIEEEEQLIMINPDNIEDLPDLKKFDDFQKYKSELKKYTKIMDKKESYGKIWPE